MATLLSILLGIIAVGVSGVIWFLPLRASFHNLRS